VQQKKEEKEGGEIERGEDKEKRDTVTQCFV
jgi:hypothetical protein